MFECELDEGVYLLLEWKIHSYPHRLRFTGEIDTCVGGLHQTGTAAGDNVAAHFRQCMRGFFRFVIGNSAGFRAGRTEDGDDSDLCATALIASGY